ncbi:hypothetical protein HMPREF1992_02084 [Selenomonas sp. oral taxon 892 str. F0426]|nr:hypothetical protein HMPREF1992_02084 [Selenomonas sp. oral taxon 892 str. F0426]
MMIDSFQDQYIRCGHLESCRFFLSNFTVAYSQKKRTVINNRNQKSRFSGNTCVFKGKQDLLSENFF